MNGLFNNGNCCNGNGGFKLFNRDGCNNGCDESNHNKSCGFQFDCCSIILILLLLTSCCGCEIDWCNIIVLYLLLSMC